MSTSGSRAGGRFDDAEADFLGVPSPNRGEKLGLELSSRGSSNQDFPPPAAVPAADSGAGAYAVVAAPGSARGPAPSPSGAKVSPISSQALSGADAARAAAATDPALRAWFGIAAPTPGAPLAAPSPPAPGPSPSLLTPETASMKPPAGRSAVGALPAASIFSAGSGPTDSVMWLRRGPQNRGLPRDDSHSSSGSSDDMSSPALRADLLRGASTVEPHTLRSSSSSSSSDAGSVQGGSATPAPPAEGGFGDDGDEGSGKGGCTGVCRRLLRQQGASFLYLRGEIARQPRSYALGWFVVFIVVMFIAVLVNAVVQSPLIFYRLSEVQAGENDLIAYPGMGVEESAVIFPSPIPLVDQQLFTSALGTHSLPGVAGSTGRWLLLGQIKVNATSSESPLETANAIMLGINSTREAELGLGRTWQFPPIPSGETYISRAILNQLKYDLATAVGRTVTLSVDSVALASQFGVLPAGDWTQMTDAQTLAFLQTAVPGLPWETIYATPLFNGTIDPNFSLSQAVNAAAATEYLFTQLQAVPPIAAALTLLNTFSVSLTFAELNTLIADVFRPPFTVVYPNGLTLEFTRPLPPPFPDDDAHPVTATFTKDGAGVWTVDEAALDQSFRDAIIGAGPSRSTQGSYVTFGLPMVLGATRVSEPLTVARVLGSPDGKFAENVGSVAMMEAEDLLNTIKTTVKQALTGEFTLSSSPGEVDLSLIVNNTDIVIGGAPLRIPPTPVATPPVTTTLSLPRMLVLAGVPQVVIDAQLAVAIALIDSITSSAYAPTSTVQVEDREGTYLQAETSLDHSFVRFTDTVALSVGVGYPARFVLPLLEVVRGTLTIRYFLDNIFNAVVALIVALGAMLVYSLLLNDVETKTYEYGMLRALGMRKSNLVQILVTKATFFSVLGIGAGLFVAFLVSIPITDLLTDFAKVSPNYGMKTTAAVVAVVIGLVMPLAANVIPISRALSKTLRDSLDVYHHVVSEVTVTMIRLADLGLDLWQTAISLLLVGIGFVTFYLIPLAFTNNNIPLFLGLLMAILLCMLLGLALLAQIVQPFLERVILWVLMRPFHANLTALVSKSLSAHRPRNSKTAQMFTIALAFIVFAGVMFALQGNSLGENVRILLGAPIVVQAPNLGEALREADMKPFLDDQVARARAGADDGILDAYSFVSFRLTQTGNVRFTRFNNLADNPQQRQRIYGIQQSYYSSIYTQYYEDVEKNTGGEPSIVGIFTDAGNAVLPMERRGALQPETISTGLGSLAVTDIHTSALANATAERTRVIDDIYTNYVDAVCSEGLRSVVSLDTDTAASIRVRAVYAGTRVVKYDRTYFTKVRGMARHVPGFFFSSYPTIVSTGSALVREDQFLRMVNDAIGDEAPHLTSVPKERLMLNVRGSATTRQRDDLVAGLRAYFSSDDVKVTDTESLIESTDFALDMLNIFFVIVGVLAMVLCFVILWLSFTANVQENGWEFGVLRAVGLNTKQVVMIYIYEALALVLACLILGTTIGIVIAVSLTLQFNLFTEIPFKMEFPFTLYFVQFGLAIFVAVLASALPAYSFVQRSISEILRRT